MFALSVMCQFVHLGFCGERRSIIPTFSAVALKICASPTVFPFFKEQYVAIGKNQTVFVFVNKYYIYVYKKGKEVHLLKFSILPWRQSKLLYLFFVYISKDFTYRYKNKRLSIITQMMPYHIHCSGLYFFFSNILWRLVYSSIQKLSYFSLFNKWLKFLFYGFIIILVASHFWWTHGLFPAFC